MNNNRVMINNLNGLRHFGIATNTKCKLNILKKGFEKFVLNYFEDCKDICYELAFDNFMIYITDSEVEQLDKPLQNLFLTESGREHLIKFLNKEEYSLIKD